MNKLETIKQWAEELKAIMAEWDGKTSGDKEDRSGSAEEALTLIDRLADLFDYLKLE